MKHPTQEEWMEYLYSESDPRQTAGLQKHLAECESCRQQTEGWRAAMNQLDSWQVPAEEPLSVRSVAPWLRWAAAAVLCASVGFASARFAPRSDSAKLRSELEQSLKQEIKQAVAQQISAQAGEALQELRAAQQQSLAALAKAQADTQQLLTEFAGHSEQARVTEQREIWTAIHKMEADHVRDLRSLRRELETVAVLTEDSLQTAQSQLVRLASLAESSPGSSTNP